MNETAKSATEETRKLSDDELRERIIQLGFAGDKSRFQQFIDALREALPDDVNVLVRGSAVIGVRWEDGSPFDADGPGTSDLDLTFEGGDMLKLWDENAFYIPKLHTAPLNDDTPNHCPALVPLRRALCKIAGRPVNIQATASIVQYMRDVLMDQPYFTLIEARKEKSDDDKSDGDRSDNDDAGDGAATKDERDVTAAGA